MSYQSTATPPPPPPAAPSPPPASTAKIKPSKAWYWIGGLLIAAGVLTAIGLFIGWVVSTSNAVDNFARVRVPPAGQEVALDFKKDGEYRIYYEWRSEADGQRVDNDDHDPPQNLDITLTAPDGTPVTVQPDDEDFSFSFNDKLGRAVAKIDIAAPGTYTMQVRSDATQPFVIAVGKGVLHTIWPWWLLGIVGAFVIGLGLGLLAIIVTAVKRGRRRRELRRATQPPGYGAPLAYQGAYGAAPMPAPPPPVPEWTPPPPATPGWQAPAPVPGEPAPGEPPTEVVPPVRPSPEPLPAPGSAPPAPPGDEDDRWGPPKG